MHDPAGPTCLFCSFYMLNLEIRIYRERSPGSPAGVLPLGVTLQAVQPSHKLHTIIRKRHWGEPIPHCIYVKLTAEWRCIINRRICMGHSRQPDITAASTIHARMPFCLSTPGAAADLPAAPQSMHDAESETQLAAFLGSSATLPAWTEMLWTMSAILSSMLVCQGWFASGKCRGSRLRLAGLSSMIQMLQLSCNAAA